MEKGIEKGTAREGLREREIERDRGIKRKNNKERD